MLQGCLETSIILIGIKSDEIIDIHPRSCNNFYTTLRLILQQHFQLVEGGFCSFHLPCDFALCLLYAF